MWKLLRQSVTWMYREIHVMIVMSQDSKLLKKSVERLYDKKDGKNISIKAGKLPKEFVAYRYLKISRQTLLI